MVAVGIQEPDRVTREAVREPPDELTGLVLAVTRNRSEFSAETGYRLARRVAELASLCEGGGLDVGRLARLTPREREVLDLLHLDRWQYRQRAA